MCKIKPDYMYTPTAVDLICLKCPLKKCKPYNCERFAEEYKKCKGEREYGSIKRNSKKIRQKEMA